MIGHQQKESVIDSSKDFVPSLQGVKNTGDVVEWFVEDSNGEITHKGVVGFPVKGAVPGLVFYEVSIKPTLSN